MRKKIITTLSILLLIQILFDPFSAVSNLIDQQRNLIALEQAQALWAAKGITSYKIKVRGAVPLGCIYDDTLTIRNNEVVDPRYGYGCNYTELNIPEFFSKANVLLKKNILIGSRLNIKFDPTYGYITYYKFNYNSSYGLLTSTSVSDCCAWYEFSDFVPIE